MLVTPGITQLGGIVTMRVNTAVSKCTRIQRAVTLANTLNKPGLLGLIYYEKQCTTATPSSNSNSDMIKIILNYYFLIMKKR